MAPRALRIAGHEERFSVVDHLEELRARLFVCLGALVVAFGLCFWQSNLILRAINRPLSNQTAKEVSKGEGPFGQQALEAQAIRQLARQTASLARLLASPEAKLSSSLRGALQSQADAVEGATKRLPKASEGEKPVTLGVAEPFTTTVTVALYFALPLALPVILFELYGFLIPAFTPAERKVVLPLLYAAPLLFVAGLLFGYFVILPTAVGFLQNFNSSQFNVMVQANQYYQFAGITLLTSGLAFEAPLALVGAVAAGLVSVRTLRKRRRYAILVCAAIGALLPGEALTMVLEAVPLYLLFEASLLVAWLVERYLTSRRARALDSVVT